MEVMRKMRKKGGLVFIPSLIFVFLSFIWLGSDDTQLQYIGILWLTISLTMLFKSFEWIIKELSKSP